MVEVFKANLAMGTVWLGGKMLDMPRRKQGWRVPELAKCLPA